MIAEKGADSMERNDIIAHLMCETRKDVTKRQSVTIALHTYTTILGLLCIVKFSSSVDR